MGLYHKSFGVGDYMFRAIKGVFVHPEAESSNAIAKVNAALEAKYTSATLQNLSKNPQDNITDSTRQAERRHSSDRRQAGVDRRQIPDRRVEDKFVLINRRKNNGRRILARGRRYTGDRRLDAKSG